MNLSQDKHAIRLRLTLKWTEGLQLQKPKIELQKALQSWANKNRIQGDFTVLTGDDKEAVIKINPSPGAV